MIRIGRYDAFDKWNILCRYWENGALVPDLGCNKFGQPRLAVWHEAAVRSASRACVEYLAAQASGISSIVPGENDLPPGAERSAGLVRDEIVRLSREIGHPELQTRVLAFADALMKPRFEGRASSGFSPALADRFREILKAGALRGLQWTDEVNEIPTLEILREQSATSFPKDAVRHKKTVLSLFSAYFYGRSDVIHIYDAAPDQVTLVDLDRPSLEDMRLIYPKEWTYVHRDYGEFLREAAEKRLSYDLIVSDPYRPESDTVAWELLPLAMRVCSDTFITNYFGEMFDELGVAPDEVAGLSRAIPVLTGVAVEVTQTVHRAGDVYWVVMRKGKS